MTPQELQQQALQLPISDRWRLVQSLLTSIQQETQVSTLLISQFNEWKEDLVTHPKIMGGQTVFPNSRLSVHHIGKIIERGESIQAIQEDYPYLSEQDLKFAVLYVFWLFSRM